MGRTAYSAVRTRTVGADSQAVIVTIVAVLFVGWFVWCLAVWSRRPHWFRDLVGGLGAFGSFLAEEISADEDEPIVPTVRNPSTWDKVRGLVVIAALFAVAMYAARYFRPIVARHWNR
jgi:hypothetical protein